MLPVRWSPAAAVAAVCLVSACDASPRPAAELSLAVSPLTLPGLTEAVYDVRVARGTPDAAHGVDSDAPAATVWARTLSSTAYGGPAGALSYVGPCDADDQDPATAGSQAPNTVYLVLAGLTADAPLVDGVDFINPCPAAAPCAQTAPCVENADTPVSFDLTVMRAARQGFFDVAVTFDDLFCSGKVDCAPALLHGPDGERARTTVLAFACTSGLDLDLDPANDTRLFANDLVVSCANGAAPDTVAVLDLAAPAGRHLSTDPTSPVSTWALYAGTEGLVGQAA